jgi:hypothetical protein
MASPSTAPLPSVIPLAATVTQVVVPATRSWTNPFTVNGEEEQRGSRLVDREGKATNRPSALRRGPDRGMKATLGALAMSVVVLVSRSRRKTFQPTLGGLTRLLASDKKATNRPSPLRVGR